MILRDVTDADLPLFFEQQRDQEALRMAAFQPRERDAFMTRWRTNWIGREHWGKGIATRALSDFLVLEPARSLHAWAALHNLASIRVLEKCGFNTVINENSHHPDAVPEIFMRLDSTE